jgi:TnpA family transposase
MPRRELLTPAERAQLLVFPTEESELIRRYTLSRPELAYVRAHRGAQNRLGIAIQLCYLQHPGRVLAEDETAPPALLGIVAAQIKVAQGRPYAVPGAVTRQGAATFSRCFVMAACWRTDAEKYQSSQRGR